MGNYLSVKDINKLKNNESIKSFTGSAEINWMIYKTAIQKAEKIFESYIDDNLNYKGWRCVVVERRKKHSKCTWNANMIIQYNHRKRLYHLSIIYNYEDKDGMKEQRKIGKTPVLGRIKYWVKKRTRL